MLVAIIFLVTDLFSNKTNQNDESLMLLKETIQNVSGVPLREKSITLDLDEEVAIIGFNKGVDSHFEYAFDGFDKNTEAHVFFMKGFFMERPAKCNIDMSCLCICRGYNYVTKTNDPFMRAQDAQVFCEKELSCVALDESIEFRQMKMPQVFDDSMNRIANLRDGVPERKEHFWKNGFIILRSDKIDNTRSEEYVISTAITSHSTRDITISHPLVVSGYMDYSPLRFIDTTVYTDSNGKIGICLKSVCNITSFS